MWQIALKAPHGVRMISVSENGESSTQGWECGDGHDDVNVWVQEIFDVISNGWEQWIIYNDEVPGESVSSSFGHCKGVLSWNANKIGWLIHSCPNWPAQFCPIPAIPSSACVYGQSFIYLEFPITMITSILEHLNIMHVHVSNASPNAGNLIKEGKEEHIEVDVKFNILQFNDVLWHVAKSKAWNKDLFDDGFAHIFGGGELVETWMRPKSADTDNVDNLEEVRWPNGITYTETHDHSKYAFSLTDTKPWVYVGDINHMRSQAHRGGGGIIIIDENLWKAFYSLVFKM